jgi:hypothetical protein
MVVFLTLNLNAVRAGAAQEIEIDKVRYLGEFELSKVNEIVAAHKDLSLRSPAGSIGVSDLALVFYYSIKGAGGKAVPGLVLSKKNELTVDYRESFRVLVLYSKKLKKAWIFYREIGSFEAQQGIIVFDAEPKL